MSRLKICAAGLLLLGNAQGTDWVPVGRAATAEYQIDRNSIVRNGNMRSYVQRALPDCCSDMRILRMVEADCANRLTRMLGDPASPMPPAQAAKVEWKPVTPGTLGALLLDAACTL